MAGNMAGLVVSEVLWYIQHNFAKLTRNDLSSVIISFYTFEEITAAKRLLFGVADTVDADYLPAHTERKGVNKVRATVDDLLGLYALLDVNKVCLPQYAVLDPGRVPMSSAVNSDSTVAVSALTSLVHDLKDQVAALTAKLEAICSGQPPPPASSSSLSSLSSLHLTTTTAAAACDGNGDDVAPSQQDPCNSWADKAALLTRCPDLFKRQASKQSSSRSGKGKATDKVKAVPRQLVCFVGRLALDTTEADLCNYLDEAGIKDTACRKLADKRGVFRTSAFRVSCRAEFHDLFYNESTWPEGAELRDWIFYPRDGAARQ